MPCIEDKEATGHDGAIAAHTISITSIRRQNLFQIVGPLWAQLTIEEVVAGTEADDAHVGKTYEVENVPSQPQKRRLAHRCTPLQGPASVNSLDRSCRL